MVRELFDATDIPLADYRLSGSLFKRLAPSPVNLNGLGSFIDYYTMRAPVEYVEDGTCRIQLFLQPNVVVKRKQLTPDADWELDSDAPSNLPWVDWSRYYTESEAKPASTLNHYIGLPIAEDGPEWNKGYDIRAASPIVYMYLRSNNSLNKRTYTGTWGAAAVVSAFPVAGNPAVASGYGAEYDPARVGCYVYKNAGDTTLYSRFYDIGGATWTDLAQSDDSGHGYFGFCWVPEKDYAVCLRLTNQKGPVAEIAAFRGTARLWRRPFPNFYTASEGTDELLLYPTQTLRIVNGIMYCLVVNDGSLQLVWSEDEFETFRMSRISEQAVSRYFGSRVLGAYRIGGYSGSAPRLHAIAAPFFAGVIPYADYEGKSCAEALADLAILTNALFWVDDDGQGHFVARDLYDAGAVLPLDDGLDRLDMDRTEDPIWEETVPYVEVSGSGSEATAGVADFSSSGLSISSDLIPNEAFAQALADSYFDFYGRRRSFIEMNVRDPDGTIYQPLDRKTLDGVRYLVYESDHNLAEDEVSLKLLEDA